MASQAHLNRLLEILGDEELLRLRRRLERDTRDNSDLIAIISEEIKAKNAHHHSASSEQIRATSSP
jgi:hypothetical protein